MPLTDFRRITLESPTAIKVCLGVPADSEVDGVRLLLYVHDQLADIVDRDLSLLIFKLFQTRPQLFPPDSSYRKHVGQENPKRSILFLKELDLIELLLVHLDGEGLALLQGLLPGKKGPVEEVGLALGISDFDFFFVKLITDFTPDKNVSAGSSKDVKREKREEKYFHG